MERVKAVTEAEWLTCVAPEPMLVFLRDKVSDRRLRLFACACCRQIWHLLADDRSQNAVKVAEAFCDGAASEAELETARSVAHHGFHPPPESRIADSALWAAAFVADSPAFFIAQRVSAYVGWIKAETGMKRATLASLLRDIFGNPFRPVTLDPSWRTPNVVRLAQTMYDERTFDKMQELGDALERAGCSDEAILGHCRKPSVHVRGCWVVDMVLGKE